MKNPGRLQAICCQLASLLRNVLREVDGPAAEVKDNEIGYFFSRDEENTIDMVLRGMVAAGGISNQDFDELPPELSEKLDIVSRDTLDFLAGQDNPFLSKPVNLDELLRTVGESVKLGQKR